MKNKVLLIIYLIVTIILTATTVVFAWFTIVEKTKLIIIHSGEFDVESKLEYIDNLNNVTNITTGYTFKEFVPNQKFNFRLTTINKGTIDARLSIELNFINNIVVRVSEQDISTKDEAFILGYGSTTMFISSSNLNHNVQLSELESIIKGKNKPAATNPEGSYNEYVFNFFIQVNKELESVDIKPDSMFKIESIKVTLEQLPIKAGDQ